MDRTARSPHTPRRLAGISGTLLAALALVLGVACADDAGSASSTKPDAQPAEPKGAGKGALMGLAAIDAFIAEQDIDTSGSGWKTHLPKPPVAEFTGDEQIYWNLETNVGPIKIELMPAVAPMHVTSTVYLTKLGFYDDVVFHRVIDGFMAQGGDPLGRGTGGPGYQYDGEFDPKVRHDRPGLLSMANAGPGTDGSQFFITFVQTPHLDGKHTIFGAVVGEDGMKTVRALEARGSRSGRTTEPLMITRATITTE